MSRWAIVREKLKTLVVVLGEFLPQIRQTWAKKSCSSTLQCFYWPKKLAKTFIKEGNKRSANWQTCSVDSASGETTMGMFESVLSNSKIKLPPLTTSRHSKMIGMKIQSPLLERQRENFTARSNNASAGVNTLVTLLAICEILSCKVIILLKCQIFLSHLLLTL